MCVIIGIDALNHLTRDALLAILPLARAFLLLLLVLIIVIVLIIGVITIIERLYLIFTRLSSSRIDRGILAFSNLFSTWDCTMHMARLVMVDVLRRHAANNRLDLVS
eukprot:23675_1